MLDEADWQADSHLPQVTRSGIFLPDDITVSGPPFIFRGEYVNLFNVRMTALSPVC
jgi:hypothetical protein